MTRSIYSRMAERDSRLDKRSGVRYDVFRASDGREWSEQIFDGNASLLVPVMEVAGFAVMRIESWVRGKNQTLGVTQQT